MHYYKEFKRLQKFNNTSNDCRGIFKNKKITANNDFYDWVNNDWLNTFKVPKGDNYIVEFDDFRLVQRNVYLQLFDIVEDYLKTSKDTSFGKCLNTFYKAAQTFSTIEELRANTNDIIAKIDDLMKDKNFKNMKDQRRKIAQERIEILEAMKVKKPEFANRYNSLIKRLTEKYRLHKDF